MHIYKYNAFLGRYFCVRSEDYQPDHPMFNEECHAVNPDPIIYNRHVCAYCHTFFNSRNQLFHHLGFLGVDTRPSAGMNMSVLDEHNEELGEFGLIRSARRLRRMVAKRNRVPLVRLPVHVVMKKTKKNATALLAHALSTMLKTRLSIS